MYSVYAYMYYLHMLVYMYSVCVAICNIIHRYSTAQVQVYNLLRAVRRQLTSVHDGTHKSVQMARERLIVHMHV